MLKLRSFRLLIYMLGESPAAVHFPENIICGLGARGGATGLGLLIGIQCWTTRCIFVSSMSWSEHHYKQLCYPV